jgi:hypothetical protein
MKPMNRPMKLVASLATAVLVSSVGGAALADVTPKLAPSQKQLKKDVTFLSADELEGRNSGHPGNVKAAEYIAARFETLGLEAIGDDNSYYQGFEFPVRGATEEMAKTNNIVGLLRGTDPELSEQVIVIGAHMDHVGRSHHSDAGRIGKARDEDDIWNGADDNASGTAAVMEAARLLAQKGHTPKSSILFMLFSAEEHGLLGSRHYVSDPIIPLDRTVAMINLDMVGRNPEDPLNISGVSSSKDKLFDNLMDGAQREYPGLRLNRFGITLPGGSDHTPFVMEQIPAIFITSGLHEDYHRVTDHVENISFEQIEDAASLAVGMLRGLGNTDDTPEFSFQTANPFPTLARLAMRQLDTPLFLGALGAEGTEAGVELGRMVPQSRGYAAGLRQGDTITAVDGEALAGDDKVQSLRDAMKAADRFATTTFTYVRDGETHSSTVVWRR